MKPFTALTALLSFLLLNFFFNGGSASPITHDRDLSRRNIFSRSNMNKADPIPDSRPTKTDDGATLFKRDVKSLPESELIDLTIRDDNAIQKNDTISANPVSNFLNGTAKAVGSAVQGATGLIKSGAKALTNVAKAGYNAAKDVFNSGLRGVIDTGRTLWDAITGQSSTVLPQAGMVTLSASALSSLAPFTQFARATYCPTSKLKNWNCGEACLANGDFQATLVGGDGDAVQQFFVGFSPSQNSVIVAHQGTNPTKFLADLTDIDLLMDTLDPALFPGTSASITVHQGFRNEHSKTAHQILAEVKRLMSAKETKNVTVIGHSLGGALAELDSLFLSLNLPKSASVKAVTYGTPRVGNPAFAKLVDSKVPNLVRMNNKRDIVPIVPWQSLGYLHPHGEVHILSPGNAVVCPGDDDGTDAQCTDKSVPNILARNVADHLGPYEGIYIGTAYCT